MASFLVHHACSRCTYTSRIRASSALPPSLQSRVTVTVVTEPYSKVMTFCRLWLDIPIIIVLWYYLSLQCCTRDTKASRCCRQRLLSGCCPRTLGIVMAWHGYVCMSAAQSPATPPHWSRLKQVNSMQRLSLVGYCLQHKAKPQRQSARLATRASTYPHNNIHHHVASGLWTCWTCFMTRKL